MAIRIPQYQPNQVGGVQPVQERFVASTFKSGIGDAVEGLGKQVTEFGNYQNELEIENDKTQVRKVVAETSLELSNLQAEFGTLKQADAREGQTVYEKRIQEIQDNALKGMGTERQRRFFDEAFSPLVGRTKNAIFSHAVKEQYAEKAASLEFAISAATQVAVRMENPEDRDAYVAENISLIIQKLDHDGIDVENNPEAVRLGVLGFTSPIHAATLNRMFADPDPSVDQIVAYADAYKAEMTPEAYIATLAKVQEPLQNRDARHWASLLMDEASSEAAHAAPSGAAPAPASAHASAGGSPSAAQLDATTAATESNNRRFTNGKLTTSPKGAMGEMQVMPDTARDPGYGVRPWKEGDLDDLARVGRDYRAAMEKKYNGDYAKMWAAYNLGPPRLDSVIARHGDNWLNHVPKETSDYVKKNMGALGNAPDSYSPSAREWDRSALYSRLEDRARADGWTPERTERVRAEIDRRIARDQSMKAEESRQADAEVSDMVAGLGENFKSRNQVPDALWNKLTGDQKRQYLSMIERNNQPVGESIKANGVNAQQLKVLMRAAQYDEAARQELLRQDPEYWANYVTPAELEDLRTSQVDAAYKPIGGEGDPRKGIDAALNQQIKWSGMAELNEDQEWRVRSMALGWLQRNVKGREFTLSDYNQAVMHAMRPVQRQKVTPWGSNWGQPFSRPAYDVITPDMRAVARASLKRHFPNTRYTDEQVDNLIKNRKIP